MNINASSPSHPIHNTSSQQSIINKELNNKAEQTIQNTDKTVTHTPEAGNLPSQAEKRTSARITSEQQAKQIVNELQESAANDSDLTLQLQTNNITSDVVNRLIS